MKLTELILQLHTLMLEKGNLDVYVNNGCGCCDAPEAPRTRLHERDESWYLSDPTGVYLN